MPTLVKPGYYLYVVLIALLAYAYLSDLGYGSIDNETDESRRALVSAEMMISGDYITPTLQGEIYLNKPPLYNWIIVSSFKLFGNYSTFALRFPVIVSIFIFGFIIFHYVKKYTANFELAFFAAFIFMTNGRILIYDSLIGLIDITFGWITFLSFMLIYEYGQQKRYYALFISSYLLTAAGYMMKGLPAIVCLGLTLLTYFIYRKQFRKLFSLAHVSGFICFCIPIVLYYYVYFSLNNYPIEKLFNNLFNESIKRTVIQKGFTNGIIHFLTFPLEMSYHFAPWIILLPLVFRKGFFKKLKQNDFIYYNVLILLPNILIYWTSPEVYARYLFMLLPLLFNALTYLFFLYYNENSLQSKRMNDIFTALIGIISMVVLLLPFLKLVTVNVKVWIRCICLFAVLGSVFVLMYRRQGKILLLFCFGLCFARIGFNWFVVESRGARYRIIEETADSVFLICKGKPLYILQNTLITDRFEGFNFHIITRRNEILRFKPLIDYNAFYIVDEQSVKNKKYTVIRNLNTINVPVAGIQLVKFIP